MNRIVSGSASRPTVRSVMRSVVTLGAASALLVTGVTFVAGSAASAAPVAINTGDSAHSTPVAQAPLTLTSTSGTADTALTLTSSGGSGTGAVTYAVTGSGSAGCTIYSGNLYTSHAGTCAVTVTKAADATYLVASSAATTVTFVLKAQATLTLTATNGTADTALTLTSSGGSGTGAVTYGVTSPGTAGCAIYSGKLYAARAGTCGVEVTKAADTAYLVAHSAATTVTFVLKTQAALTLTSKYGRAGTALRLTSSGGSGSGAVTYGVTSSGSAGCKIYSGELYAARAGTCGVEVTKAADATYLVAHSAATTVTFAPVGLKVQTALALTSTTDTVGTALTLTSSGGSGTGVVTYAVANVGTAGCAIASGKLNAARAGTCTVTVTKAADATYLAAHSAATTVTFAPAVQAALTLTSIRGTVGKAITLTSSGGSGTGAVTYAVTSFGTAGCGITASKLNAARAGTCTVTVTKAADTTYLAASSPATTVTFKAKVIPVKLTASKVNGFVWIGQTVNVAIIGTGFYNKPTIKSNEAGTSAVVIHDYRHELVVRVRLFPGSAQGWHVFTVILANGHSCKVKYFVKAGLSASRVSGFARVGQTVNVAIIGAGFYNKPIIKSNETGTGAVVIHDLGNQLVVRVKVRPGSARGWHVFTITLANGHSCKVKYFVK